MVKLTYLEKQEWSKRLHVGLINSLAMHCSNASAYWSPLFP
jgi:hypothetical protein